MLSSPLLPDRWLPVDDTDSFRRCSTVLGAETERCDIDELVRSGMTILEALGLRDAEGRLASGAAGGMCSRDWEGCFLRLILTVGGEGDRRSLLGYCDGMPVDCWGGGMGEKDGCGW